MNNDFVNAGSTEVFFCFCQIITRNRPIDERKGRNFPIPKNVSIPKSTYTKNFQSEKKLKNAFKRKKQSSIGDNCPKLSPILLNKNQTNRPIYGDFPDVSVEKNTHVDFVKNKKILNYEYYKYFKFWETDGCYPNNPCLNGGSCCSNSFGQPTCTCLPGYTGPYCGTRNIY